MRRVSVFAASLFLILQFLQCAHQVAPEGGAVDKIPPVVIRTEPDSNAVRVNNNRITLEFSEYVDRRTVEESIFISPPVSGKEFEWSGKEVTIILQDTLRPNVTYVVTVGTDVTDKRGGVRMASGYTLAFSTGDSIDRGAVSGKVFDEKPEGISVFAYRVDTLDPDTLDPSKQKPDYLMQTGKGGTFTVANLAWGQYRLFAVRDEYRNLLYDRQTDQYGVSSRDVELTPGSPHFENLWFRMTKEDTTRPFLSGVRAATSTLVLVRFSEKIDSALFAQAAISITDTLTLTQPELGTRYLDPVGRDNAGILVPGGLTDGSTYRIRCQGVADSAGNSIDSEGGVLVFQSAAGQDTLPPSLVFTTLRDSVNGYDLSRPLEIVFSEPVRQERAIHALTLVHVPDSVIPVEFRWLDPIRLHIRPQAVPAVMTQLEMRVSLDSVLDLAGNAIKDSVRTIRFRSFDVRNTGELEGKVLDSETSGTGWIQIAVMGLKGRMRRDIRIPEPGPFTMELLPDGQYVLMGYRDADSSGTYSYGRPYPYVASERFGVSPDTVRVRARWGVEGVTLQLR